jgi:uncharacterized protein (DUF924 family)
MTSSHPVTPADVLDFWFGPPVTSESESLALLRRWFLDGPALDDEVKRRFTQTIEAALRGDLDAWADDPRGRVALIIVLDQLTRHVFRGTARTWDGDAKAQALALEAIDRGLDQTLGYLERTMLGMPLAHAENLGLQVRSAEYGQRVAASAPPHLARMASAQREQSSKYHSIIARFGRFPFRNSVLGRTTSSEEQAFLAEHTLARHAPRALADQLPR